MKTIKIIDIQKICNGCKFNTYSLCDKGIQDIVSCEKGKEEVSVIEEIPETWEELKELCKKLNNTIKDIQVNCIYEKHIVIQWYNNNNKDIDVYDNGKIFVENYLVTENRTPAQMWYIIKNLMEKN